MTFRVLVCDPISDDGVAVFKNAKGFTVDVKTGLSEDEICKIVHHYDALVVRSQTKVTDKIICAGTQLKIIGRAGVGLDNVDTEAATRRGIVVMNTPGGNTTSTAELSFAMLLALSRLIPQANTSLRSGQWDRKSFKGVEVSGKTLGILGMGRIGTEVARRARAFNMKVIAYDPYASEEMAKQIGVEIKDLDSVIQAADYLTIHTPLTDETRNLINRERLARMKKGARIINCARGGIVNEKDLVEALNSGQIAGAAFDVYSKEPPEDRSLIEHPKTVCTPHLGASTEEAQSVVAVEVAHQIVDALTGKGIRNAANIPFIDPKLMEQLSPYLVLGEKLGLLGAQLAKGFVSEMAIDYSGEVTEYDVHPITVAILKGALAPFVDHAEVNAVNAPYIAKERGLVYTETKSSNIQTFTNLINVTLKAKDREISLSGAVTAEKNPHIVRIDGYHVDMKPFGWHLLVFNQDKPGLIGAVGTILGDAGVNISDMTLGRKEKGGSALAAIALDEIISEKILNNIRLIQQVISASLVNMGK